MQLLKNGSLYFQYANFSKITIVLYKYDHIFISIACFCNLADEM